MRIETGNQWRYYNTLSIGLLFHREKHSTKEWGNFSIYVMRIDLFIFYVEVEW